MPKNTYEKAIEPIYVVGAGSVGTYLAGHLCRVADVSLVTRDEKVEALRDGIRFSGSESGEFQPKVLGWSDLGNIEPQAQVLITTKITQLGETLSELQDHFNVLQGLPQLTFCQNGLDILAEAEKTLGPGTTKTSGRLVCWFGVRLLPSAELICAGGNRVVLAGGRDAQELRQLGALFEQSGLVSAFSPTVQEAEWKKAIWNVANNGVCAIADVPNGKLIEDPNLKILADQLITEGMRVAEAEGVCLTEQDREAVYVATRATAPNLNSTVQDLRAGRMTEIPWLNGAVVRLGQKHGIETPTHLFVSEMISALETKARSR